ERRRLRIFRTFEQRLLHVRLQQQRRQFREVVPPRISAPSDPRQYFRAERLHSKLGLPHRRRDERMVVPRDRHKDDRRARQNSVHDGRVAGSHFARRQMGDHAGEIQNELIISHSGSCPSGSDFGIDGANREFLDSEVMKVLLACLMSLVFTISQSFAISGGPWTGGKGVVGVVGTYAGTFQYVVVGSNNLAVFTLSV